MAMPGGGFLLLKEYGRVFEEPIDDMSIDEGWDPMIMFAENNIPNPDSGPSPDRVKVPPPHYGYARYTTPINIPYHDRGDLSMYYFPSMRGDSSLERDDQRGADHGDEFAQSVVSDRAVAG